MAESNGRRTPKKLSPETKWEIFLQVTAGEITLLVIAVCLIPLAGLFGGMDAALQRVSKARVDEMRRDGVKRAGVLSDVVAERARHVALLLLLRIACEMVAAVLLTVVLHRLWGGGWQLVLTAAGAMTVVSYVLVGVGPRTLGRQHAYGTALAGAGVVRLLAQRLRTTDAALADSVFLDVTGRTAKRLLELAGDADEFVLPVTQEELAGMVGASRERVNKALSAFIRLGWLEQSERRYRITDREQLSRRAR